MKKFYDNKDTTVLLFLARAYYESEKYEDCSKTLQKAIHMNPDDKMLWFDLALSEESSSYQILRKKQKTVIEMRISLKQLKQASK